MDTTEVQRLAAAVHQLRPDWPVNSLRTFVGHKLSGRAYQDAVLALVWVAIDPETKTPARVLEAGPWWQQRAGDRVAATAVNGKCQRCGWWHASTASCEPVRPSTESVVSEALAAARAVLPPSKDSRTGRG